MPIAKADMSQANVQRLAQAYGMDFQKLWELIQKLSEPIKQIILILLDQNWSMQGLAQAGPPLDIKQEEINQVANDAGISAGTLWEILQKVGPLIAQLILAILNASKPTT